VAEGNVDEAFQEISGHIRAACSKGPEFVDRAAAIGEFLALLQLLEFVECDSSDPLAIRVRPSFLMALRDGAVVAKMYGRKPSRAILNLIFTNLGYSFSPLEMLYAVQAIYLAIKRLEAEPMARREDLQTVREILDDFEERFIRQGGFDAGRILNWIAGLEDAKEDMA